MADTELEALTSYPSATPDEADVFYIVDVSTGVPHKLTVAQLKTLLGAEVTKAVTTQQNNTTVTPAAVTQLSMPSVAVGQYRYKAEMVWQAAALTTGISMYVTATGGAVSRNVGHMYTLTTANTGSAETAMGTSDQSTNGATLMQIIEGKAWRANNSDPGPWRGVDTINADQFTVLEGTVIVTTALTSLDVMFRSEVAGSQVAIMPGSVFTMEKVA